MADDKKGWKWWQQAWLGGVVVVFILLCLAIGFRQPWIEPLPGVRMTRPLVRETSLGPDSAYFLMLEAIRPPAEPLPQEVATVFAEPEELFLPEPDPEAGWPPPSVSEPEPLSVSVWRGDWSDALTKFKYHPWPSEPPPPSLPVQTEPGEEFGGMGMFGDYSLALATPWTREQYEDILRLNRLYEPRVARLDRALAAPDPQMPSADSFNFLLPYLSEARQMARWLAVSAHYKAGTGDCAGAFRDVERILGLGNLVCRGGSLINHLVGIACDAIAADATWVIASREGVPAPILRDAALAFLAAHDEAEPYGEAIRAEALVGKGSVHLLYRDPSSVLSSGFSGYSAPPFERALLRSLFGMLPLLGSTPASTTRNLDACYQHLVVLAEKPYTPATVAEYRKFADKFRPDNPAKILFRTRDPLGLLVAAMTMPALDRGHLKATHRDAILLGMALFLAVRAYETEHGEPPETLDALVPDYLPRVPEDPFDGKPFRYLRRDVPGLPPEAWAVYSIGENFTDEGGTAKGVGTYAPNHGTNPDFVWPSVDYPKNGGE